MQELLAEVSGLGQQHPSGQEQARRNPTFIMLFEIASAPAVSHAELVRPD